MKIVLASKSERRIELLKRLINDFEIKISDFNEKSVDFKGSVDDYVKEIALGKGMNVKSKVCEDAIIISADTVVTLDNRILGKPRDENDAFNMLKTLQGKNHYVYSGVALINKKSGMIIKESVRTKVKFSNISDDEIYDYIKTKEPMDKAGAYGIQGFGGVFVENIEGCYYNVVGLPLNKLKEMLKKII